VVSHHRALGLPDGFEDTFGVEWHDRTKVKDLAVETFDDELLGGGQRVEELSTLGVLRDHSLIPQQDLTVVRRGQQSRAESATSRSSRRCQASGDPIARRALANVPGNRHRGI
jgi:hypothetical protein